jgi:hypothetical protein
MYWLTGSQHFGLMDPLEMFAAILKGSMPQAALHPNLGEEHRRLYASYVQTYPERDVVTSEGVRNLGAFELFLRLLAARAGQLVNMSSMAREVGVSVNTIKGWMTILERTYQVYTLHPYYRSLAKRLVKTPKVYFTDAGLQAYLTGWHDPEQALRGPLAGQMFENWVVANVLRSYRHRGVRERLSFWRTRTGGEIDLWAEADGGITASEVKLTGRLDTAPFRPLDNIDPAPMRFGRRVLICMADRLLEFAPGTWALPARYLN